MAARAVDKSGLAHGRGKMIHALALARFNMTYRLRGVDSPRYTTSPFQRLFGLSQLCSVHFGQRT